MSMAKGDGKAFTAKIKEWHSNHNTRSLPWKEEKSAYKIWLSEIILQQTRALQGLPYYLKFAATYPTVHHLAAAEDDAAFKLWEGLGYYARCRNMLATARYIVDEHDGIFPHTYEGLLSLKGIGPYTAAAIASFAYGLPHAVVDGNVYRVLARYFGITTPTDGTEGKKLFQALADSVLDRPDPGAFNQGIMDHGATVCTPADPNCSQCPVSTGCMALADGMISQLPFRAKRPAVRKRYLHYLLLHHNDSLWIRKRVGSDIWKGLYEPLIIEEARLLDPGSIVAHDTFHMLEIPEQPEDAGSSTQRLTHQLIETRFFSLHTVKKPAVPKGGIWVNRARLADFPFPRTLINFFKKKGYF